MVVVASLYSMYISTVVEGKCALSDDKLALQVKSKQDRDWYRKRQDKEMLKPCPHFFVLIRVADLRG
jgi:hypothetical protein